MYIKKKCSLMEHQKIRVPHWIAAEMTDNTSYKDKIPKCAMRTVITGLRRFLKPLKILGLVRFWPFWRCSTIPNMFNLEKCKGKCTVISLACGSRVSAAFEECWLSFLFPAYTGNGMGSPLVGAASPFYLQDTVWSLLGKTLGSKLLQFCPIISNLA